MITGKTVKQYLEANTALLQLIDAGEYDLLLSAVEDDYRGYILMAIHDAGLIEGKMSYTVYRDSISSIKTMLCAEHDFTPIQKWATKQIGANKYWYITNDLTGEIVYINEE